MLEIQTVIAEEICSRILRKKYESGEICRDPSPQHLIDVSRDAISNAFVTGAEWDIACQIVQSWQDEDDLKNRRVIDVIAQRFKRIPTVAKIQSVFGDGAKEEYEKALNEIENDPNTYSKFSQTNGTWRKFDMKSVMNLLINVIVPNIGKSDAEMRESYCEFNAELRARSRERSIIPESTIAERKKIAKELGIWFPIHSELHLWRTDPRTASKMKQFEPLMNKTWRRMKECRNILQFVTRKRITKKSCADIDMNIERMRRYLSGYRSTKGIRCPPEYNS